MTFATTFFPRGVSSLASLAAGTPLEKSSDKKGRESRPAGALAGKRLASLGVR